MEQSTSALIKRIVTTTATTGLRLIKQTSRKTSAAYRSSLAIGAMTTTIEPPSSDFLTTTALFDNCTSNCSREAADMAFLMETAKRCDWPGWGIIDIALFIVGTFGNVFSLILMRRRGLRSRSYALSLSALALFNSLTLFVLAIQAADRLVQNNLNGPSLENYLGDIGCKFYRIALPIVQLMSHWIVVFITTERFVAICFPLALPTIFSGTKSKITLGCVFGAVLLAESWRPFFDYQEGATYTNDSNGTQIVEHLPQCSAEPFNVFANLDMFFHQLLMLFLLPALLIFLMNSAVIVKVYQMGREIRKTGGFHRGGQTLMSVSQRSAPPVSVRTSQRMTSTSTYSEHGGGSLPASGRPPVRNNASSARSRKTTVLLLAVSCSFLIYNTPLLAFFMYIRFLHLAFGKPVAGMKFQELCMIMRAASVLSNLSYADNFIIFVLAGEKFRGELRVMMYRALAFCFPKVFADLYDRELARSVKQAESTYNPAGNRPVHNVRSNSPSCLIRGNNIREVGSELATATTELDGDFKKRPGGNSTPSHRPTDHHVQYTGLIEGREEGAHRESNEENDDNTSPDHSMLPGDGDHDDGVGQKLLGENGKSCDETAADHNSQQFVVALDDNGHLTI